MRFMRAGISLKKTDLSCIVNHTARARSRGRVRVTWIRLGLGLYPTYRQFRRISLNILLYCRPLGNEGGVRVRR